MDFPFNDAGERPVPSEELLALSFVEGRPMHVEGATLSSPERTVLDYRGALLDIPQDFIPLRGGYYVRNLLNRSELEDGDMVAVGTPTDPLQVTVNSWTIPEGSTTWYIASTPSTVTFTAEPGYTYAFRVRVQFSRDLVEGEQILVTNTVDNFILNSGAAVASDEGAYALVFSHADGSPDPVTFSVEPGPGSIPLTADLTITLSELMVIRVNGDNRFPDIPHVPSGQGEDLGFGSDDAVYFNHDEYGYPLRTSGCWVENLIPNSDSWTDAFLSNMDLMVEGPFTRLERPAFSSGSRAEKSILAESGTDTVQVLLELRAGSTDVATISIEDTTPADPSDVESLIVLGPGRVVATDNQRIIVTGLSERHTTTVHLTRKNLLPGANLALRVSPDYIGTEQRCNVLVGRTGAGQLTTHSWRTLPRPVGDLVETGRPIANDLPNSIFEGAAYGVLPSGWDTSAENVALDIVGVEPEQHRRYLNVRIHGNLLVTSGSAALHCTEAIEATQGEYFYVSAVACEEVNDFDTSLYTVKIVVREYDDQDRLLREHESESSSVPTSKRLRSFILVSSDQAHHIRFSVEFHFNAEGNTDCVFSITEPQLTRGAVSFTPFVPTSRGREQRVDFQGLNTHDITYAFDSIPNAKKVEYLLANYSIQIEPADSPTITVPSTGSTGVLSARLLPAKRTSVDLITTPQLLGTYTSLKDRQHVVQDHENKLWFTQAHEARRYGYRRVEQLLQNNDFQEPTEWSSPQGTGRYSLSYPSVDPQYNVQALSTDPTNTRVYLAQDFDVDPFFDYTLSINVDYCTTNQPNENVALITNVSPLSSFEMTGSLIEGERSYGVLRAGSDADVATARVGLGTLYPIASIEFAQFSRPSLVKGSYVGERSWVSANHLYNAGVEGVAYLDVDQSGNPLRESTLGGVEILPASMLRVASPNDLDTPPWVSSGGTLEEIPSHLGDARLFRWTSDGTSECCLEQECFLAEGTYTATIFGAGGWLYFECHETFAHFNPDTQQVGATLGSPIVTFRVGSDGHTRTDIYFGVPLLDLYNLRLFIAEDSTTGSDVAVEKRELSWVQLTAGLPGPLLNGDAGVLIAQDNWTVDVAELPEFNVHACVLDIDYTWYGHGDVIEPAILFSLYSHSDPTTFIEYNAANRRFSVVENNVGVATYSFGTPDQSSVVGRHTLSILIVHNKVFLSVDSSVPVELPVTVPDTLDRFNIGSSSVDQHTLRGRVHSFKVTSTT